MLKNLLVYRIATFNVLGFALLAMSVQQGWVFMVHEADASHISLAIWALWAAALAQQGVRGWKVARTIDEFKASKYAEAKRKNYESLMAERDKAMMKVAWMDDAAAWLMRLGLIGTVVGFIMALSGVSAENFHDADSVQQSVGQLIPGMRVALFTTLLGMILGTWVEVNRRMVVTALHNYHCDRILRLGR